jgi:hypothetical protein
MLGTDFMLCSGTTAFRSIAVSIDKRTLEAGRDELGGVDRDDMMSEISFRWLGSGCLESNNRTVTYYV